MEIGNLEIHFHKWVNDSQGAIYCVHCRKFKKWASGEIKKIDRYGAVGVEGWGYLLNGREWKEKKDAEIRLHGLYL